MLYTEELTDEIKAMLSDELSEGRFSPAEKVRYVWYYIGDSKEEARKYTDRRGVERVSDKDGIVLIGVLGDDNDIEKVDFAPMTMSSMQLREVGIVTKSQKEKAREEKTLYTYSFKFERDEDGNIVQRDSRDIDPRTKKPYKYNARTVSVKKFIKPVAE